MIIAHEKSTFAPPAIALILSLLAVACGSGAQDKATSSVDSTTTAAQTHSGIEVPGNARIIEVDGFDYAFRMPDTVDAGRTAFRFSNTGRVRHEYNVVLLKPGVTLAQFVDAANRKEPLAAFVEAPLGVLFADTSETSPSFLVTDLLPNRSYAIHCVFRDSTGAPSHRELGMFHGLAVRAISSSDSAERATAASEVKIDSIVGNDYAFTSRPEKLAAGWHEFAFRNAGKQRHEVNFARLRAGKTVDEAMKVMIADGDIDALFDEFYGLMHVPASQTALGRIGFEVEKNREYVLICSFQDTPDAKPHFMLGMVASIKSE